MSSQTRLPDDPGDSKCKGMSNKSDDVPAKGREGRKTKKEQIMELANSKCVYEASKPGRIPNGLGVIHLDRCCK